MSGRRRRVAAALGSRATMAAPSVVEEGHNFAPGGGEPNDGQRLMDSTVTAEPEPYEPVPAQLLPLEPPQLTPEEIASIKALTIQASIDAYDGSCPCPYHEARDGRRSAYSRAGGEEPLCYPEDVSDEMVREYWVSQQ